MKKRPTRSTQIGEPNSKKSRVDSAELAQTKKTLEESERRREMAKIMELETAEIMLEHEK